MTTITFTPSQMEELSQWEEHFTTIKRARYCRRIGEAGLKRIHEIYQDAIGRSYPVRWSCSTCVFSLVDSTATIYFRTKAANDEVAKTTKKKSKKTTKKTSKGQSNED